MEHNSNQLTLLPADSLAKTFQYVENKKESLKILVRDYGKKPIGCWGFIDPQLGCLKMSQGCFAEEMDVGLNQYSLTWPESGIMLNGKLYQRPPLVRVMKEKGYLLTPSAQGWKAWTFRNPYALIRSNHQDGNLQEQLMRLYQRMITSKCVEIMMMFPEKWTDLNHSETQ